MPNVLKHPVLINGQAYQWSDTNLIIGSRVIMDWKGINYGTTMVKQDIHGGGTRVVKRGYGKEESTCSLTLSMEEVEFLMKDYGVNSLIEIQPFTILVTYQATGTLKTVTDTIHYCEFRNNSRNPKMDDLSIDIELDIVTSHITFGNIL